MGLKSLRIAEAAATTEVAYGKQVIAAVTLNQRDTSANSAGRANRQAII